MVSDLSGRRIFDPATQRRAGARFTRHFTITIIIAAIVCGAMIGGAHYEEHFLAAWLGYCDTVQYVYQCAYPRSLDWLAGLGSASVIGLAFAPLVRVAHRRVRPPVFCRRCPGMGWVEDLADDGRCPLCRYDRFDFQDLRFDPIHHGGMTLFFPQRVTEHDVPGAELMQRDRSKPTKRT